MTSGESEEKEEWLSLESLPSDVEERSLDGLVIAGLRFKRVRVRVRERSKQIDRERTIAMW